MPDSEENLPLSKTKKKKLSKDIQALAHSLVDMPQAQFKKLQLSADLIAEVHEARNTIGRGSHKRQVKHLAAVLRQSEEQVLALVTAIENIDQVKRSEKRQFHKLEELRDRLCDEKTYSDAFDEMILLWPGLDSGVISRLARSVHTNKDKRAYREIFKRLRDYVEQQEIN
jgi:ribosome-associated protein